MDILDNHRINAITPFFVLHGLQDLIPLLRDKLLKIRLQQKIDDNDYKYKFDDWNVTFDKSFVDLYKETRLIFMEKVKHHYPDINNMIEKTYIEHKSLYSHKSKDLFELCVSITSFDNYLCAFDLTLLELPHQPDTMRMGRRILSLDTVNYFTFYIKWDY